MFFSGMSLFFILGFRILICVRITCIYTNLMRVSTASIAMRFRWFIIGRAVVKSLVVLIAPRRVFVKQDNRNGYHDTDNRNPVAHNKLN